MAEQEQSRRRGFQGSTRRTLEQGAMLGAKWWAKGDKVSCMFQRTFPTKFGEGYNFTLINPKTLTVSVDEFGVCTKKATKEGHEQRIITAFAMPPLAGFDMALQDLQANGFDNFRAFDRCTIECVDIQEAKDFGFSDMPMFEITVEPR